MLPHANKLNNNHYFDNKNHLLGTSGYPLPPYPYPLLRNLPFIGPSASAPSFIRNLKIGLPTSKRHYCEVFF